MINDEQQAFRLPPQTAGTTYLNEHVIALFPTFAAAQAAGAALEVDGFAGDQLVVATGEQLLSSQQALRDQRGVKDRLLGLFPSEEAEIVKDYERYARQGHAVVAVYAPDSDRNGHDRAVATLRSHGGHSLHYYGKHVVVDL